MFSSCKEKENSTEAELPVFEPIETDLPLKKNIADSLAISARGTDYLFVVDADCSLCLSVLFKELDFIDCEDVSRFIIVASPASEPTIKYYMRETHSDLVDRTTILIGPEVLIAPLEDFNGNFYKLVDGLCVAGWEYWGE